MSNPLNVKSKRELKELNLKNWEEKIKEWRVRYGVKPANVNTDLTYVTAIKVCKKCGKARKKMSRHHKGHEFLFACILPDKYAERYIQFHINDVDWLCDRCHNRIHVVISPIVDEVYTYVFECLDTGKQVTYSRLEFFRSKIIKAYVVWVNFRKKKKKK